MRASTLLCNIYLSFAAQEYEVPWAAVVEQRTGVQSKRRWNIMMKNVPEHVEKSFAECLTYLVDTYAPQLRKPLAKAAA